MRERESLFGSLRGHLWFIRRFGPLRWFFYEQLRRSLDRKVGRSFDPVRDGEAFLRGTGATEEQIAAARKAGLA